MASFFYKLNNINVVTLTDLSGMNKTFFMFLKYLLYVTFAYLNVNLEEMYILALLMGVDTLCGTTKSLRLGNVFDPRKLAWGFVSKFLILIIPMIIALMGKPIHKDFVWVVDVSIRVLIINEGLSVLANIISVYTKQNVQNVDLISKLINWIRSLFVGVAEKLMNENKNNESDNFNNK